MTVFYNKQKLHGKEIQIYPGGSDYIGATNVTTESTRTGYFLRKWVSSGVDNVSQTKVKDYHPVMIFRKAEVFLNYAEASLEAYGIDKKGDGMLLTARQAIAEVRRRAGITSDPYLASIKDEDEMRKLIRNERRIELCFENHRYYDLRRWKVDLDQINTPVKGIFFANKDDKVGTIKTITMDGGAERVSLYENYMYYGPVPNSEVLITGGSVTQNAGW